MSVSFNVLDDPWIPVVDMAGKTRLLGIRETLRLAPELREIASASPLEEFSLYRFLCVFLMDALRPQSSSDLRALLHRGAFDVEQIETYISLCRQEGVSFDLFDEKRPFMQASYVPEWDDEAKSIAVLDCFRSSGNNHMHFDHGTEAQKTVPMDKAARLILTVQQFCTASAQGYPSGVNASPPWFSIVKGASLFEILVFTLQPVSRIDIPFDDPPVLWRSTEAVAPKKPVGQTSWLRGMYFPARRVRLVTPENGREVSRVYLSQGENFVNKDIWTDPFVTYRTLDTGPAPLRPRREKPLWRSLYDVIDIPGNHAAGVLEQYIRLSGRDFVEVTLYGVQTSQASYLGIRRQDLRFSAKTAQQAHSVALIRSCVEAAERLARKLRHSLSDENILPKAVGEAAVDAFYQLCEKRFWQLCELSASEDKRAMDALYRNWCAQIGGYAEKVHDEAVRKLHLRGRSLGRVAEARRWLLLEIRKIKGESVYEGSL